MIANKLLLHDRSKPWTDPKQEWLSLRKDDTCVKALVGTRQGLECCMAKRLDGLNEVVTERNTRSLLHAKLMSALTSSTENHSPARNIRLAFTQTNSDTAGIRQGLECFVCK